MSKRILLLVALALGVTCAYSQSKWNYNFGLGAALNTGNVNNFNLSTDGLVNRNDSIVSFDLHYKVLYSSVAQQDNLGEVNWKETNFEINSGVKMDLYQWSTFSPFLACEQLTNKYKGYDLQMSGLLGVKYKIYVKPSVCDYSISAALVYNWTNYTNETQLPINNYRFSIRPKITQKLAESLTLYHCTLIQPSLLNINDLLINSITKLQTQLSKRLFLDISFTYDYRSLVPDESYKKNDILTEVSIRFKG